MLSNTKGDLWSGVFGLVSLVSFLVSFLVKEGSFLQRAGVTHHTNACTATSTRELAPTFPIRTDESTISEQLQSAESAAGIAARFAKLSRRVQFLVVGTCSIAVLIILQQLLHKDHREDVYLESYGSLVASQLARLGQDAMVREDAIALNVLAEQVASESAILEVEIYSMDGGTLASYSVERPDSASGAREFTRPIQLADATAGFVKVVVAADALQGNAAYQQQEWLRLLAAGLLSCALIALLIYGVTRSSSTAANPTYSIANTAADVSATELDEQQHSRCYLLLMNLFNGNDMPAARRAALMSSALNQSAAVAEIYQGRTVRLTTTSLAVVFDQTNAPERSFEAACAALVLARLGNRPGGARYRYSLQQLKLARGADGAELLASGAEAEQIEDALLHAALAEDDTIALTAAFARELPRPERLELTSEHSQALSALHSSRSDETNDYFLLSSANSTTLRMLERQVESMRSEQYSTD